MLPILCNTNTKPRLKLSSTWSHFPTDVKLRWHILYTVSFPLMSASALTPLTPQCQCFNIFNPSMSVI